MDRLLHFQEYYERMATPSVERRVVGDVSAFVGESVRLAVQQVC